MLDNIPAELRHLAQWVCAGLNKEPIDPRSGQPASTTNPSTWATFDEAKRAGYMHVGFVLSKNDPYTIIDLDDPSTIKTNEKQALNEDADKVEQITERHKRIATTFNSYTELSQSGTGVHIIVRGSIPSGVRRDKVEVYSDSRYMICTGNVINASPIADYQDLLLRLHSEMASTVLAELEEIDAIISDDELYSMASKACNAEKFLALFSGNLSGYPSQSEADFALISMLAFYSKSDSQVRRIFRWSTLGQRDKATRNDDYINRALTKIRGRQKATHIDLTELLKERPSVADTWDVPIQATPPLTLVSLPSSPLQIKNPVYPPGLIGEIAEYIYSSAPRPVHEVGLAAAIAFGAGIVGRHFNISGLGLAQYIMLIAETGTGKEYAHGGIDALCASIRAQVPAVDSFVGPGTFASGQALTKLLDRMASFVSVQGEFGITLQQICNKNASSHDVQLRKVLLALYGKSGWNSWLRPSVYADADKNTALVRAPNVTILGESTADNFYGALDRGHISEGLIPRFLVIQYAGIRVPDNVRKFHHASHNLVTGLTRICQTVLTMQANEACCPVQIDQWAVKLLAEFDMFADGKVNNAGDDEVIRQLWTRAQVKALKLSALVAVGCSHEQPIVTHEIATWSIDVVHKDIDNITAKFSTGEVGQGDHAQEADVMKAVARYSTLTQEQKESYRVPKSMLDKVNVIPYVFFKKYLTQRASFKNDRRGAVMAIQTSLGDIVKAGILQLVPTDQAKGMFSTDSPLYYRGSSYVTGG